MQQDEKLLIVSELYGVRGYSVRVKTERKDAGPTVMKLFYLISAALIDNEAQT